MNSLLILVLLPVFVGCAWAAKAPLSPEQLKKTATHIISGEVIEVKSKVKRSEVERAFGIHRDKIYTIKLNVRAVTKGGDAKPGDEIMVEAWTPHRRIPPHPGLQGHSSIPNKGDTITVYVASQKAKVFKPIVPNGMSK